MPYGAVFTSSAGGAVGGPLPFTRVRGQLLVGQSADPGTVGSQTGAAVGGATGYNGSAAAPLYSFYNRPDSGWYASNQTSSASDVRYAHLGLDWISYTTVGMTLVSTAGGGTVSPSLIWASTGFVSTDATDGFIYIPQTTAQNATSSGGGTSPTARKLGAAIVYDAGRNKIMVYSTVAGNWLGTAVLTSS